MLDLQALAQTALAAVPDGVKAPISFTKETPAAIDAATGRPGVPVSVTVNCLGVEEKADPKRYAALNLQASELKTVFLTPLVAGVFPELDSACVWGGRSWTLRDARPYAANGSTFAVSGVIAR